MAKGQTTLRGDIVREYLKKFPKTSKNAIARLLVKENQLLFKDTENARSAIRFVTRTKGKLSQDIKNNSNPTIHNSGYSRDNPFGLPQSHEEKRDPFILPKVNNNILIISDLHIPYHSIDAINCAIKYGLEQKVNTIFINGDLMDFYQFSRFEKDLRKRRPYQEFKAGREFIVSLRKIFKTQQIYFHLGNHDIRYEKWLLQHPETSDDPELTLETRLRLITHKIHLIGDKQITKAGKLSLHHGHYIFRGAVSPVSPARTILLKAKKSMCCGHTHKISEATGINIDGEICTCWSGGCLCELLPDYSPMCNDNGHGFQHARINDNGTFSLKNIRIHEGKIL